MNEELKCDVSQKYIIYTGQCRKYLTDLLICACVEKDIQPITMKFIKRNGTTKSPKHTRKAI